MRLDREPGGALPECIVRFASKPLPASIVPPPRPISAGKSPSPRPYRVCTLRQASSCPGGAEASLGFASAPPGPSPLKIQFPMKSSLAFGLACLASSVATANLIAQVVAPASANTANKTTDTPLQLSPFEVNTSKDWQCQFHQCHPRPPPLLRPLLPDRAAHVQQRQSTRRMGQQFELFHQPHARRQQWPPARLPGQRRGDLRPVPRQGEDPVRLGLRLQFHPEREYQTPMRVIRCCGTTSFTTARPPAA